MKKLLLIAVLLCGCEQQQSLPTKKPLAEKPIVEKPIEVVKTKPKKNEDEYPRFKYSFRKGGFVLELSPNWDFDLDSGEFDFSF